MAQPSPMVNLPRSPLCDDGRKWDVIDGIYSVHLTHIHIEVEECIKLTIVISWRLYLPGYIQLFVIKIQL